MDSVSICNMALLQLGIGPITSFEDQNDEAKLCKRLYPVLRDRVLRDHLWSFATAFYDLQENGETKFSDPEYPFECNCPSDLIRVISLTSGGRYRRIGHTILVDELPARLQYIRRVEDPGEFDVTFTEALQYLLASEFALAHTRDRNLVNMLKNEYERKLSVARAIDSQENIHTHQNRPQRSSWLAARRMGV